MKKNLLQKINPKKLEEARKTMAQAKLKGLEKFLSAEFTRYTVNVLPNIDTDFKIVVGPVPSEPDRNEIMKKAEEWFVSKGYSRVNWASHRVVE